jgi:hypothetical protein
MAFMDGRWYQSQLDAESDALLLRRAGLILGAAVFDRVSHPETFLPLMIVAEECEKRGLSGEFEALLLAARAERWAWSRQPFKTPSGGGR